MLFRLSWMIVPLLVLAAAVAAHAGTDALNPILLPPAPLNEQVMRVPGDPARPVTLEVTLYTPPGTGPFPLAVLNHGATNASSGNRGSRYRYTFSAYYFLSRGYAVALPMARGFAGSGGAIVHDGCGLDFVGRQNAQDVRAVIEVLGRLPGIDRARVVVSGQSFGAWTTMALGDMDIPGVRGLIGFSPALRASDCTWQDQAMIAGARQFGAGAKYPSLWIYGDNDSVMPVATWRGVFSAWSAGARQAELLRVGSFMEDSHQLLSFPEGLPIWAPRVDAFPRKIGMPSTMTHPGYMPLPTPPPSHFAAVEDVSAVPWLSDKGRESYRQFLTRHFPRVFMLSQSGDFAILDGGFDPLARGFAACRQAGISCDPYAIDGQVVWTRGKETPRVVTRTVPAERTTTLNFAYAVTPECHSRGLPKLRVSEAPQHGAALVSTREDHPAFPPGHPFAGCNGATVPGVALTYTPTPGFAGADTMMLEETMVDGAYRSFRFMLTVR